MAESGSNGFDDIVGGHDMSKKRRKQRKEHHNAPHHKKRKIMSSALSGELRDRYDTRSIPVKEGDEVEVMRGSFKGHIDKVARVDRRNMKIYVENVTVQKADESKEPFGIHPSNLRITKLDLSDPWRKEKLEKNRS